MRCSDRLASFMARNIQPVSMAESASLTSCLVVQRALLQTNIRHSRHALQKNHAFLPHSGVKRLHGWGRQSNVRVSASWGAPVEWKRAEVVESVKAADELQKVLINVGDVAKDYSKAGQFVQFKVGESKPGFFAIASTPAADGSVLEFIVKEQGDTAKLLCGANPGDEVDVSSIMGKGFPIDRIPPETVPTVYIFATGTGIAPIKALIESGALQADKRKSVTLYYGTRNGGRTAYLESIPSWREAGVSVVCVYSESRGCYVQDAFLEDVTEIDGEKTAAILCGQKELGEALTLILTEKGVPKENILFNF